MAGLSRTVGVVAQTRSHHDYRAMYHPTISQSQHKLSLFALNGLYIGLIHIRDYLLLKPETVLDNRFCWKRIKRLLTSFSKILLYAASLVRIRETSCPPKRTQQHPLGHVLTPELQRFTEDA